MNSAPRVAIYTRISRDDAGDSAGVSRQEEDCRALASRRGWIVTETLVDNDLSAFDGRHRPGYERLLELIRTGAINAVVAWAPERLHRSPRQLEDFIELIEEHSITVETVKAGLWDVTTSHGRLVARMLGAVSRAESERTGERVSRAHQQALGQGLWRGAVPYGFLPGDHGRLTIDKERAKVVRSIAKRALRGESMTSIAADLNRKGVSPQRGTGWTHTSVQRLLQSPALGGFVRVDGDLRPAAFKGILSGDDWMVIQSTIAARPLAEKKRPRETLTLLGGIVRCSEHDVPMMGATDRYGTQYQSNFPGLCCIRIGRRAVDEFMQGVILERLGRDDALAIFTAPPKSGPSDADLSNLIQRRAELVQMHADGLIPASEARTHLERLTEQIRSFGSAVATSPFDREALSNPTAAWTSWTMPQRREVVRILFTAVAVQHTVRPAGPRVDLSRLKLTWRS